MSLELSLVDKSFLGILLFSFIMILHSMKKPVSRRFWLDLGKNPRAVVTLLILLLFFVVGILDSIRFPQTMDGHLTSRTILDGILSPIDGLYEKTYSAPLSLNLHVTEIQYLNGHTIEIYPLLIYPAGFFKSNQEKMIWIQMIIWSQFKKISLSILLLYIAYSLWKLFASKKIPQLKSSPEVHVNASKHRSVFRITRERFGFCLKKIKPSSVALSFFISLFIILLLVSISYDLSRHLHVFGTGKIGEDIFYYSLKSIRTGLVIGILTTVFMMPLALLLGIASGFYGGVIDDLVQYLYTTLSSIPGVLLISASVLSLQTYISNHPDEFSNLADSADARLLALCFILGITSWTNLCRLLRAETLKLKEIDYIFAARSLGTSSLKIMLKHLLPNLMSIVLMTLVLDFSFLVLAESVLSYVGVGVSPLTISWGNMINAARLELSRDPVVWWPISAAFFMMFILVLSCNLFADSIRESLDPHRRFL